MAAPLKTCLESLVGIHSGPMPRQQNALPHRLSVFLHSIHPGVAYKTMHSPCRRLVYGLRPLYATVRTTLRRERPLHPVQVPPWHAFNATKSCTVLESSVPLRQWHHNPGLPFEIENNAHIYRPAKTKVRLPVWHLNLRDIDVSRLDRSLSHTRIDESPKTLYPSHALSSAFCSMFFYSGILAIVTI